MKQLILEMKHMGYKHIRGLVFASPLETRKFRNQAELLDFVEKGTF